MDPNAQKDLLLTTDYPIDKIAHVQTGSLTIPNNNFLDTNVSHGLTYRPLYLLKWSLTSDFSTSYDETGVSTATDLSFNASTSSIDINFEGFNFTGSSVTIYYRVIYFMPFDVGMDAAATSGVLDDFQFNTDYNYTKIYLENKISGGSGTVSHGLGYFPQVEAWYTRSFDSRLVHFGGTELSDLSSFEPICEVSESNLQFIDSSSTATEWYYRVYLDEN